MLEVSYFIANMLFIGTAAFHKKAGFLFVALPTTYFAYVNWEVISSFTKIVVGVIVLLTISGYVNWNDLGKSIFELNTYQKKIYAIAWFSLCIFSSIMLGESTTEFGNPIIFSLHIVTWIVSLFMLIEKIHIGWITLSLNCILMSIYYLIAKDFVSMLELLLTGILSVGVFFFWSVDYYNNIKYTLK